jgi:HAE1 family hydrophobic/amphiphilic exporter-1
MAHAVIGGLISSTILALIVVPVFLSYIDSLTRRASRFLPKVPDSQAHDTAERRMTS